MKRFVRAPLALVTAVVVLVGSGTVLGSPAFAATAPPTHFTVGAISTGQMRLTWHRAAGDVAGYEVFNGNESRMVQPSAGSSTVSYVWGGMRPEQYMCFRIRTRGAESSTWVPDGVDDSAYRCAFTPRSDDDLHSLPLAGLGAAVGIEKLHGANFNPIRDDSSGREYRFANPGDSLSIDVLARPRLAADVTAVRSGIVRAVWRACDLVLVNSGDLWWIYMHVKPKPGVALGYAVERGVAFAELVPPYPASNGHYNPTCKGQYSDAYHVHLAAAKPVGAYTAQYVSLEGMRFCGHPLWSIGDNVILEGLTVRTNQEFTIPRC